MPKDVLKENTFNDTVSSFTIESTRRIKAIADLFTKSLKMMVTFVGK